VPGNISDKKSQRKPSIILRLFLVVLLVAAIVGVLAYIKIVQIGELTAQAAKSPPAIKVEVEVVKPQNWQSKIKAVGSLVAVAGVDLTSETSGTIVELNFQSGQKVAKGDVLLTLEHSEELARVKSAEAQLESSESQYKRTLKNKKYVSELDLDGIKAKLDAARASFEVVNAALAKKTIKAPFSGTLGISQVEVGDFLSPGKVIVNLANTERLYVDFTLPERFYKEIAKGQELDFRVTSYPDKTFRATVVAWNPEINKSTRTAEVRAIADNQSGLLAPGMFAEIELIGSSSVEVLSVPETAIFYNIYGEAIYVLKAGSDAKSDTSGANGKSAADSYILESRKVEVLYRKDGKAGVVSGLKVDDKVVTSGQLKLYPGLKVVPVAD
jgi:membrane fusion protein, multidrug efflux system